MTTTIRPATVRDVPAIARLISQFAERGKMLFRSHAELYETIRDFSVWDESAEVGDPLQKEQGARSEGQGTSAIRQTHRPKPDASPAIRGVCALQIIWGDLAEIKSLAVDPAHQGRGIGGQLVRAMVAEAARLHVRRVFALTYEQRFFEKLGFAMVDKSALPLKVWSDCVKCPKRDGCDEIAMVQTLFSGSAIEPLEVETEPHYDVPTSFVQLGKKS